MKTLIFVHLEKTAGSTMRRILTEEYGEEGYYYNKWTGVVEYRLKRQNKQLKAIWGHFKYFGIHKFLNTDEYYYFTILREPIQRFCSIYLHQFQKQTAKLHKLIHQNNLSVIDLLDDGLFQYHNHYVRYLTGNLLGELDEYDLERALDILDRFDLIGFTDKFNLLFQYLKKEFNWKTKEYRNVHIRGSKAIYNSLSDKDKQKIADKNWMDVIIWEEANKKWRPFWEKHFG